MNTYTRVSIVAGVLASALAIAPAAFAADQNTHPAAATRAPAVSPLSGHTSSSHNGLTCNNNWYNTYGGSTCSGNTTTKWRSHVACASQSDYTGQWHYGAGSDGFECTFSVQNSSVEWG